MSGETNPPQSEEVERAIAELLDGGAASPDPWWEAGMEESLEE